MGGELNGILKLVRRRTISVAEFACGVRLTAESSAAFGRFYKDFADHLLKAAYHCSALSIKMWVIPTGRDLRYACFVLEKYGKEWRDLTYYSMISTFLRHRPVLMGGNDALVF